MPARLMTFEEFAPQCVVAANSWIDNHPLEDGKEPSDTFSIIATLRNCIQRGIDNSPRDWTPCAEGLPTVMKRYNVTWIDLQDGQRYSGTNVYSADEKRWDNENQRYKVLAWQPLPEPWTGGLDGK